MTAFKLTTATTRLIVRCLQHCLDQPSEKRAIESADELLTLLQDTFGIRLPAHPQLRETLDGLIVANSREP